MDREIANQLRERRKEALLEELERVKTALISQGAEKIILFGSAAKGALGLFSDIDLIVIIQSKLRFLERMKKIYLEIKPKEVDIFAYTREEFESLKTNNPFVRNALKEGEVIYEKNS